MSLKKYKKEDLELLSNKDIAFMLLEDNEKSMTTATIFKKIIKLLELPEEIFENKIGDFYVALSTDKRFILLSNGQWDLRNRHTSDKVLKAIEEDDEEDENLKGEDIADEIEEDDYDSTDDDDYIDEEDDLKDLVILDEDELE